MEREALWDNAYIERRQDSENWLKNGEGGRFRRLSQLILPFRFKSVHREQEADVPAREDTAAGIVRVLHTSELYLYVDDRSHPRY